MPKLKIEYVSSRDEAVAKLIEAGSKILDRHTPEEIQNWALTTADKLIKSGRVVIGSDEATTK